MGGGDVCASTSTPSADADAPAPTRPPRMRESSLMPRYLVMIRSGAKTVEGRIRVGKWADVVPGDLFRFVSNDGDTAGPCALCRATTVRHYDTFRGMLEGEGLHACLPGVATLEEGVELYRSIPGYREQEAQGVGVVGVGVVLVPEVQGEGLHELASR